ncbi:MAG: hypothetical protein KF726_09700 [Anaerolineae bacterium]|nr:hypothetical protein [Anaerolineae bacterium]
MKTRIGLLILMIALIGSVLVILFIGLTDSADGNRRGPIFTAWSIYATNTWVAERRAETMTATYSVKPD